LPLDYRPKRQTLGNGRKLVLKDRTTAGLQTWLSKQGLTTPKLHGLRSRPPAVSPNHQ
jgi:hypothetical protein